MEELLETITQQEKLLNHYRSVNGYTVGALRDAIAACKLEAECPAVGDIMKRRAIDLQAHLTAIEDDYPF